MPLMTLVGLWLRLDITTSVSMTAAWLANHVKNSNDLFSAAVSAIIINSAVYRCLACKLVIGTYRISGKFDEFSLKTFWRNKV